MASMVMDSISNGLVLNRTSAVDNQCDFFHSCIQIRYGISSNSFTGPFQEKIALFLSVVESLKRSNKLSITAACGWRGISESRNKGGRRGQCGEILASSSISGI